MFSLAQRAIGIGFAARLRGELCRVEVGFPWLSELPEKQLACRHVTVTVVAMVIAAMVILRNMPPRMIVMATGFRGRSVYDVMPSWFRLQTVQRSGTRRSCNSPGQRLQVRQYALLSRETPGYDPNKANETKCTRRRSANCSS